MRIPSFEEKIQSYLAINPNLSFDNLGSLLLIDSIYDQIPADVSELRSIYAHFDPKVINNHSQGIIFLKIAESRDSVVNIKKKLNDYINIKFNYLGDLKSYEENMVKYNNFSKIITKTIDNLLDIARLPECLEFILREESLVRNCHDFYEMLEIYKTTSNRRIKFEILRKVGLIVLLSRINRSFIIEEYDSALNEVKRIFAHGLGLCALPGNKYFLWVSERGEIKYSTSPDDAKINYQETAAQRSKNGLIIYPIGEINVKPFRTKFGLNIFHICARNKFRINNEISYTSLIEKIIRKNLLYPTQVHDIIGLKIIVNSEHQILEMISCLETFLGGSSTRMQEKNSLNRFGRRKISKFSSDEYYVWKAFYDIPLPHPSIRQIENMLSLTRDNPEAQKHLHERLKYFKSRPKDFVVEVQLQDVDSYFLSITKGSSSDHSLLKMNQIRTNSFYKLFPKEIYQDELIDLKQVILKKI